MKALVLILLANLAMILSTAGANACMTAPTQSSNDRYEAIKKEFLSRFMAAQGLSDSQTQKVTWEKFDVEYGPHGACGKAVIEATVDVWYQDLSTGGEGSICNLRGRAQMINNPRWNKVDFVVDDASLEGECAASAE